MGIYAADNQDLAADPGASEVVCPLLHHADVACILLGRTVWEIKQRTIVDMAADRGAFIDQSQSLNIHLENPNFGKLTSLHFYTWRKVSRLSDKPLSGLFQEIWG